MTQSLTIRRLRLLVVKWCFFLILTSKYKKGVLCYVKIEYGIGSNFWTVYAPLLWSQQKNKTFIFSEAPSNRFTYTYIYVHHTVLKVIIRWVQLQNKSFINILWDIILFRIRLATIREDVEGEKEQFYSILYAFS